MALFETGSGTYENRQVLEAIPRTSVFRKRLLVFEDEGDLDNSSDAHSHQGIPKHGVSRCADHEFLWVSRHAPSSDEDHEARDEVSLWVAVTVATEPNASKAGAPPDDAHGRVLPVILDPSSAPTMLSEGIDTAPSRDHGAVVKLLRAVGPAEPNLADQQDDGEDDAVSYESASHDEVGGALSDVVTLTEPKRCDAAKEELGPGEHRHKLADDRVAWSDQLSNLAVDALLPVALEVKT